MRGHSQDEELSEELMTECRELIEKDVARKQAQAAKSAAKVGTEKEKKTKTEK